VKTLFVVLASILLLSVAIIFVFTAKDIMLISAALVLVILAFYALWRPPKKLKDYSLSDQQEATTQSGATDLLDVKPIKQKFKRKK
jgi:ABC-type nickel/cobalt efflux system permease component RcnA